MKGNGEASFYRLSLSVSIVVSACLKAWGWAGGYSELHWWTLVALLYEVAVGCFLVSKAWVCGAWLAILFATVALVVLSGFRLYGIHLSSCGCFGSFHASDALHVVVLWGVLAVGVRLVHIAKASRGTRK